MKHLFALFTQLALCGCIQTTVAQTYQVTTSQEPFIFLVNGAPAVDGAWDVPEFALPIGFDFELFDLTSDTLYSFFNSFGGVFEVNLDEDHLYMLIPLYCSLTDRGYSQDSALSPIQYSTEGPPGQQVFTLEFKEAGLFNGFEDEDAIYTDHVSFQIRLYEATGDIVFHYGPYVTQEEPEIIFDPFAGPLVGLLANADWNTLDGFIEEIFLLEGDPLASTLVTDQIPVSLTGPIPENTVYRFSRMDTGTQDQQISFRAPVLLPNPTTGILRLNETQREIVSYPIVVFDLFGKEVAQWKNEADIIATTVAAGNYYAVIRTAERVITEKLIVLSK